MILGIVCNKIGRIEVNGSWNRDRRRTGQGIKNCPVMILEFEILDRCFLFSRLFTYNGTLCIVHQKD